MGAGAKAMKPVTVIALLLSLACIPVANAADNATALRVCLLTVRSYDPGFDAYYTPQGNWRWFGHSRGRYEFEKCLRDMGITFGHSW
jgi:hypothetical protein